jgi:hypothetical protein
MTNREEFAKFIYPIDVQEIIRTDRGGSNLREVIVPDLDSIEEVNNLINQLEQEKDNADLWPENRRIIHLPNILLRLKGRLRILEHERLLIPEILEHKEAEVQAKEKELQEINDKLTALTGERNSLGEQLKDAIANLQTLQEEKTKLKDDLAKAQADLSEKQKAYLALQGSILLEKERKERLGQIYPFKDLGIEDLSMANIEKDLEQQIFELEKGFDEFLEIDWLHREQTTITAQEVFKKFASWKKSFCFTYLSYEEILEISKIWWRTENTLNYREMTKLLRRKILATELLKNELGEMINWNFAGLGEFIKEQEDSGNKEFGKALLEELKERESLTLRLKVIEEVKAERKKNSVLLVLITKKLPYELKFCIKKDYCLCLDTEEQTMKKINEQWYLYPDEWHISKIKSHLRNAKILTLNNLKEDNEKELKKSTLLLVPIVKNMYHEFQKKQEEKKSLKRKNREEAELEAKVEQSVPLKK